MVHVVLRGADLGAVDVMTNTPAETYIDFYRFKYPATVKRHHGFTLKADYFRNGPKYNVWCYGHAMPGANGAELRVTSARPEKGPWLFGLAINTSEENQGKAKR